MDRELLQSIRTLLETTRVLSLAYTSDGVPEVAMLPFAVREDYGALVVQASTLARHAEALTPGARVGVLIHVPDGPSADPMQLARLSVQAAVTVLDKGSDRFARASARFVARFRAAGLTLGFADFSLYELALGTGRYVEGFARAFDVTSDTFQEIGTL